MTIENAYPLINVIVSKLFEPEERKNKQIVDELVTSNSMLLKTDATAFKFNGAHYHKSLTLSAAGSTVPELHKDLVPTMLNMLQQIKEIDEDKSAIRQGIGRITRVCLSLPQLRNNLPEALVQLVPELSKYERTGQPADVLKHDERAMIQYRKIETKIMYYATTRLIY